MSDREPADEAQDEQAERDDQAEQDDRAEQEDDTGEKEQPDQEQVLQEREERLDPDNRPDNVEVDNTDRTFDPETGFFEDREEHDSAPKQFVDEEAISEGADSNDDDDSDDASDSTEAEDDQELSRD